MPLPAFTNTNTDTLDAGETWVRDTAYKAGETFTWTPTQSTAVDSNGDAIPQTMGIFAYVADQTSLDAAEPTLAEFALMKYFGPAPQNSLTNTSALVGGFIYLSAEKPTDNIFEMNGQTLVDGVALYPLLAAAWPAWVSGADINLPDWRGRAMMATGALGITGAAGATYNDATARNGLRIVYTANGGAVDFAGGSTMLNNGGSTWQNSNIPQQNFGGLTGDTETRPNAVGLVLCVIAGDLAVETVEQPVPTSFTNLGAWNGVNLQNVITNGMLVGVGTGAAGTGAPHGAFTGSCKITRIGDWVQQDFLTANAAGTVVGERFSRQSFNAGVTWSDWLGQ